MFVMNPVFVVIPFGDSNKEMFEPPRMAFVEEILRALDGDCYLCRLAATSGLPRRWRETFVRLDGVDVPEGTVAEFCDGVRAEMLKDFAARRILGAERVTLREFRWDKSGRMLVDVHVDHCDLSAMLTQIARSEEAELARLGVC